MLELIIADADRRPIGAVELTADRRLVIGRASDCDIRIPARTVSRRHAEILPDPDDEDTLILRDLGSTHGIHIGPRRIKQLTLSPGCEVRLGPATLLFNDLASRIGAELDTLIADDDAPATPDATTAALADPSGAPARRARTTLRLFRRPKPPADQPAAGAAPADLPTDHDSSETLPPPAAPAPAPGPDFPAVTIIDRTGKHTARPASPPAPRRR